MGNFVDKMENIQHHSWNLILEMTADLMFGVPPNSIQFNSTPLSLKSFLFIYLSL